LQNEFEVNDIGEPKMIIGVEIHGDRERGTVTISQKNYVRRERSGTLRTCGGECCGDAIGREYYVTGG
jgi:hypothetical protein